MKKIILASNSPRRKELLGGLDIEFTVDCGNSFVETVDPGIPAAEVPLQLAKGKSHGFHRMLQDDELLITADTVVISDGADGARHVLGKPHGRDEAIAMLKELSGKCHEVVTAVCMRDPVREAAFSDSTLVWFSDLSEEEIAYYVDRYKPFDKAGSYGIQEWIGFMGISRIEGSFYNVMGFPVHRVWAEIKSF